MGYMEFKDYLNSHKPDLIHHFMLMVPGITPTTTAILKLKSIITTVALMMIGTIILMRLAKLEE